MLNPVVGHPVCDLDLQRRIREARVDALARSVRPKRRSGRHPKRGARGDLPHAGDVVDRGDDIWRGFRF